MEVEAATAAELERVRREALQRVAREAVPPRPEDLPWQDPIEAASSDEVRRALEGMEVPAGEISEVQGDLAEQLLGEETARVQEETQRALQRDQAVEAIQRARSGGNAAEIGQILRQLDDADREEVVYRVDQMGWP